MTVDHRPGPTRAIAHLAALTLLALVALTSCGASESDGSGDGAGKPSATTSGTKFPDVRAVELTDDGAGSFTVAVTLSSPYDSAQRYADGWRVTDTDGNVLGTMTLGHDHASEQPFTRTQTGLEIPDGVDTVEVEGHDTENGYGGRTMTATVPGR